MARTRRDSDWHKDIYMYMENDPIPSVTTRNNGMSKPCFYLHIEQKHINLKWACVYA